MQNLSRRAFATLGLAATVALAAAVPASAQSVDALKKKGFS